MMLIPNAEHKALPHHKRHARAVNQSSSCCWPPYAARAGQPGGKGWIRLSPRGVQEGQEVDPVQPPVPSAAHKELLEEVALLRRRVGRPSRGRAVILLDDVSRQATMRSHLEALLFGPCSDLAATVAASC
jgi:hypothetical protein